MTFWLIEKVVDGIQTKFESDLATALDLQDAEYADFTLEDIKDYYVAEIVEVPETPAVFILGDDIDISSEGPGYSEGMCRVIIACIVGDADSAQLRRRLYRYMSAMYNVVRSLRDDGWNLSFETISYSPLYAISGTFLSDAQLIVLVNKLEVE